MCGSYLSECRKIQNNFYIQKFRVILSTQSSLFLAPTTYVKAGDRLKVRGVCLMNHEINNMG